MRRVALITGAVVLLSLPAVAFAAWRSDAAGTAVTAADTMTNAASFTAQCSSKSSNSSIRLDWTISPDPYVSGYRIVRTSSLGDVGVIAIPGRTTATHVDSGVQANGVVFTYTIEAVSASTTWTTASLAAVGQPGYTGNRGACLTG